MDQKGPALSFLTHNELGVYVHYSTVFLADLLAITKFCQTILETQPNNDKISQLQWTVNQHLKLYSASE